MNDGMYFDSPNLFIANQLRRKSLKTQEAADKNETTKEIDLIRNKLAKFMS